MDAAFDHALESVDTAMIVVTTAAADERAGCLVGFHAQCSIEPRRYVVWLSKSNHTFRVGLLATHFAVHYLSTDDLDVAEHFGTTTGDEVDKFASWDWSEHHSGVPVLDRCANRLVARRTALLDEGSDHVCVVLEPIDVTYGGRFHPLRLSAVKHLRPGHQAEERPTPLALRERLPPGEDRLIAG
jgi:flavin reductase (DIM6/NTAB) family NADH-FMN oxidoreductase RutF